MFYAHIVLAKKGPFARIWLAAHWDKKLTKAHVFETNIEQSVEGIMQPKVKLALRTSGHLLLGVVRIYSRKAKYLLADCNEAFVKIKMAFRPGVVDLPEDHREAAVNAITLPEVFHDFDTALPELNDVDIEAQFSINQSRADEITMREEYGSLPMSIHDEGFGDMGFDDADYIRDDPNIDENLMNEEMEQSGEITEKEPMPGTSRSILDSLDTHELGDNDGFGDGDGFGQPAAGLFEGDLFADAPLEEPPVIPTEPPADNDSDDDMDGGWIGAPPSTASSFAGGSRPATPEPTKTNTNDDVEPVATIDAPFMSPEKNVTDENDMNTLNQDPVDVVEENLGEQTTLLNNEEESFALAPVDASALKGVTKAKRKRKLIVDEIKNISGEEMKSQLANTSDIITTLDLAPPTKRLMYWKDTGGVEKVFTLCSRDIKARILFKNIQRHFVSRLMGLEDFSILGPLDVLALDQYQQNEEPLSTRRGRKRKLPATISEEPAQTQQLALPPPQQSAPEAVASTTTTAAEDEMSLARDGSSAIDTIHSIGPADLIPTDDSQLIPSTEQQQQQQQPSLQIETNEPGSSPHSGSGIAMSSPNPNMLASPSLNIPNMSPSSSMTGGRTPADLSHGGDIPPLNIGYAGDGGGVGDNCDGGSTPLQLPHGGMTPGYAGDFSPSDLHNPAYTPGFSAHGSITPHHGMMENLESIPNLPADQVSSILNGTVLDNIGYSNMGYDDHHAPNATPRTSGGGMSGASERIPNDWNDDYEFPPSVGAHQPGDEQMENETDEQFEERVLNKRAAQMFISVRTRMQKTDHLYLSEMTIKNNRKQAAQKFYSLLVLKKFQALEIKQEESYGDILVTKGIMFDNPKL